MQDLENWFTNKDYATGVMLYSKYGKYKSVLRLLQLGENDLRRSKLLDCMNRLRVSVGAEVEERSKAKSIATPYTSSSSQITVDAKATPQAILQLDKKWKPLYGEMATLHARLLAVDTKEMRYSLAMRITDLHSEITGYWEQIAYYKQHGKMPEKVLRKKVKEGITSSDLRKLTNARTALSNYTRKRLPAAQARLNTNPTAKNKTNLERTLAAIEKYKKQISEYEKTD